MCPPPPPHTHTHITTTCFTRGTQDDHTSFMRLNQYPHTAPAERKMGLNHHTGARRGGAGRSLPC